ncbi:uncharacterized protein ndufa4l2a isoform X2 [Nerophis lumbriciformis]|uniref:uncharacterized protein ndufa4l2a isoform X2 n=1 Tax=Nerophis lumbriciformis TaxID=546530 RepID=UPI003BAB5D49
MFRTAVEHARKHPGEVRLQCRICRLAGQENKLFKPKESVVETEEEDLTREDGHYSFPDNEEVAFPTNEEEEIPPPKRLTQLVKHSSKGKAAQKRRPWTQKELIPQFFFIVLGMGGASLYLMRLAKGPHVTWNKSSNPEPWNKLHPTYQYKFVTITTDYKKLKKEGPEF